MLYCARTAFFSCEHSFLKDLVKAAQPFEPGLSESEEPAFGESEDEDPVLPQELASLLTTAKEWSVACEELTTHALAAVETCDSNAYLEQRLLDESVSLNPVLSTLHLNCWACVELFPWQRSLW